MKCRICGAKDATVHLTEVVDDEIRKVDLCGECAEKQGITTQTGFGLANLLLGVSEAEGDESESAALQCERCGLTQEDFRRTGRLGCAECYEVFSESVSVLIKGMHHGDHHVGKSPASEGVDETFQRIRALKNRLDDLVRREAFEEAARVRDEIRRLEAPESDGGDDVDDRRPGP